MGRKSARKKAAFQRHCRDQVRAGLINDADGQWRQPSRNLDGTSVDVFAGYHFRGTKRKGPKGTKVAVEE